jgi:type I restriction enzyme S subunit
MVRQFKDSGIEWIGEIPDEWTAIKFKYVATVKANLVHPSEYANYPQIAPDNIEKGSGRLLLYKSVKESNVISDNHLFYKGQIVYSKIRPVLNKLIIAPFDGLCSADMYPLTIKSNASKIYVKHLLLGKNFLEYAIKHSGRARMPKINREALFAYSFPLPPLSLQQEFAEKVESIERQKALIRQSIDEVQTMFDYTMDKYFG